jgi:hypothetical protein
LLADQWQQQEVADDGAGGGLVVSVSTALVSGLASWAVVAVVRFAAGAIGAVRRRRLAVLGDDEHGELAARR